MRVIAGAGGYGFYMIGSDGSVDLDPALMAAVLERPGRAGRRQQRARLAATGPWTSGSPRSRACTWAAGDQLRSAVGDGPLITDDRPLPEYFLLRRLANPHAPGVSLGGLRALLH